MARILRGDVIWANLNPAVGNEQFGKRSVLILSHEVINKKSRTVIAAASNQSVLKSWFPLDFRAGKSGSS